MRTSALFLVFALTGAQLLPAIARAESLDAQTATTTARQPPQVRDRVRAQLPERISTPDPVVPDLTGTPARAGSGILARSRLRLGRLIVVDSEEQAGTIVRQQPGAGSRVRADSAVDVFVSNGKGRGHDRTTDRLPRTDQPDQAGSRTRDGSRVGDTMVPDLRPVPPRAWSTLLEQQGLQLGRIVEADSDQPRGTLLQQRPQAGTRVPRGTPVSLQVSNGDGTRGERESGDGRRGDRESGDGSRDERGSDEGRPTRGVRVPNITGQFIDAARGVLQESRLRLDDVKVVESSRPRGLVLDQGPRPGAVVSPGDGVDVVVSQGPPVVHPQPPPPRGVRVPNVVGQLVDPARLVLEQYRLQLDDVKWVESPTPQGVVLQQYPQPDQVVRIGSTVNVVVSQGPPRIVPATVPAVVGEDLDAAVAQLRSAALQPGTVRTVFSKAAKGVVIGQAPGAGARVDRNSLVHLDVSAGERLVAVPALVNGRFDVVGPALEKARLQVGTVSREEARLDAGIVIAQDPAAGSQVREGTPVNIRVSLGILLTEVPDLLRVDLATAARLLEDKKLRLGVVERKEARSNPGIVLEQSHPSGSKIRPGTPIGVVVSIDPPLQTVPDLVRRTEDAARAELSRTRLQIGIVSRQEASIEAGLIVTQEPAAGSQVPADTRVNLRVSLGEPQVTVPALANLHLESATGLLQSANLRIGTVQRGDPRQRADIILAQSPQAGSQVRRGTTINVIVSSEEPLVIVPNLVPRSEQYARATIATLQLEVGDIQQRETQTAAGLVLSQSMAPGSRVPRGTRIGLVISAGPAPSSAEPPLPPLSPPSAPPPNVIPPPSPRSPNVIPPPRAGGDEPPAPVDPWPPIPELPWPWIASLGFGVLYGIQRLRARGKGAPDSPRADPPPVPQIDLVPRLDRGWQEIAFEGGDDTALALELTFAGDAGTQRIVEAGNVDGTEQHHEYPNTDTQRSLRHRPRRAS